MRQQAFRRTLVRGAVASAFAMSLPVVALADTGANTMSAPSQPQYGQSRTLMQSHFDALDTNHDGVISRAEFEAHDASTGSPAYASSHYIRATNLMGSDVRSANGQDIGEVQDLLVDVNAGKVKSAIVSLDTDSDKLYRYPISAFAKTSGPDELVLKAGERGPEAAQVFARNDWPSWVPGSNTTSTSHLQSGVWQAKRLIGKDIEDRNGDHLGEITDLVIDRATGSVKYAVMRYDRPWSLDNPLVAVPLESFNFGNGRRTVSLNVDRDNVDHQLAFDAADPRSLVLERWIVLIPENATGKQAANTTTAYSAAGNSGASTSGGSASGTSTMSGSTSASAPASSPGASAQTSEFDRLDTNHDGVLSQAEYAAASSSRESFSAADKDSNSAVTRSEFAASRATQ